MDSGYPKPDCYKCKHRRSLPGDAHSSCAHPGISADADTPLNRVMAIFASVGQASIPVINETKEIKVVGHPTGIMKGWFVWPWNFDPIWLVSCTGYEEPE